MVYNVTCKFCSFTIFVTRDTHSSSLNYGLKKNHIFHLYAEPELIPVNLSCQVFDRLQKDMPKYFRGSTLFEEKHKNELLELSNPDSKFYNLSVEVPWLLHSLKDKKTDFNIDQALNESDNPACQIGKRIQNQDHGTLPKVNILKSHFHFLAKILFSKPTSSKAEN